MRCTCERESKNGVKAQPKKKSGPDLECYEKIERHEIWIDVGRVNLMWQVWEKTKKNLSVSPISLYNRFYSISKHLIRILTHYIFFNRNNKLFHIYKHNHNKCLIL